MWPKYDKPFYFHFRDEDADKPRHDNQVFRAITVCMKPIEKGGKKFKAGLACCSLMDNFSKKKGRMIAEGRAEKRGVEIEAEDLESLKRKAHEMCEMAVKTYTMARK